MIKINRLEKEEINQIVLFLTGNATPVQMVEVMNKILHYLTEKEVYILDKENPDCRLDNFEYLRQEDVLYCTFENT